MVSEKKITFAPLSKKNWNDFEKLFGERGACGGCWCMTWRLSRNDFEKQKGEGNKKAMKKLVHSGKTAGILAYAGDEPAGWCALSPREEFIRLEKSRVLKKIDEQPVQSITCFFIAKPYRRKGMSVKLLKGVIAFAKKNKIKILEAYPVIPYSEKMPDVFAWTGLLSSYQQAGFIEAARHSEARPIMRYYI